MFLERADAIFESDISGSGGRHESGGGRWNMKGESGTVNKQHCLPECGPYTRRSDFGEGLWQRCITKDCGMDFVPASRTDRMVKLLMWSEMRGPYQSNDIDNCGYSGRLMAGLQFFIRLDVAGNMKNFCLCG